MTEATEHLLKRDRACDVSEKDILVRLRVRQA